MTAASATTNATTNGFFDQTASELKKIRNVKTPSGAVMRVTAADLKWFNHFYTFTIQGNVCFQGRETLAREMGISSISTVQDRINKLVNLGFLTVGKKKTAEGWVNSYTTTPVDIIVSMMTDEPVTKQQRVLKKSQLKSYVNKSAVIDRQRRINNVKAAARAAGAGELTDDEAIDFALCAAAEKLSLFGWDSELSSDVAEEIDEHANDLPVQNDGYQSSNDQDQVANDYHVVGNPVVTASVVDTAFTSVFAVVPVIEDAFAVAEKVAVAETFAVGIPEAQPVEPATAETWLDAPFTPHGELIPEAVQYCLEQGVADPEEQKHFVRKRRDPNYVREKRIYNPTLAPVLEWEDVPF